MELLETFNIIRSFLFINFENMYYFQNWKQIKIGFGHT